MKDAENDVALRMCAEDFLRQFIPELSCEESIYLSEIPQKQYKSIDVLLTVNDKYKVIIEDKTGLKKNSLFGTEVKQTQDTIENFCEKIAAGKKAQKTKEFMICARIESLILEQGMEDALNRAFAYVNKGGADAIMIHSRKKDPAEIIEFVNKFREQDNVTPIVVVPTSFNTVTEDEFKSIGVNVVIYANQLTRTGFPAMQNAARTILEHHRAKECDDMCMSIKEIINLIPEE
jgi:phosphoenolpyruvate phosphomutase